MIKSIFKLLSFTLVMIGFSLLGFAVTLKSTPDDGIIHAPQDVGESAGDDDANDDKEGLPLKPERKIEFETDEGTWLALDVSPDGENITFLSDKSGADNVYVVGLYGESPRKLSDLKYSELLSPEWPADSQYIYVSQNKSGIGSMGLWMYHKNGGKGLEVIKVKEKLDTPRNRENNIMGVSASKDGRYIYYAKKQGGFSYNMTRFSWTIVRHDLMEGTTNTIITAQGGAIKPEISPDGSMLVYDTRHETETGLRVRDLSTGEDRWLAYPVTHNVQESLATRDLLPRQREMPPLWFHNQGPNGE